MRRVLYVHCAIHALLRSLPRPISLGLHDRRLTLLVRIAIAQYVDDVNRFIAKQWLAKPDYRLPTLCVENAERFETLDLTVESCSGQNWGRRKLDFVHFLQTTKVTSKSMTFLRVLHTIRTELSLSDEAYTGKIELHYRTCNVGLELIIPAFCREARKYGRSWTEYNLDGVEAFDSIETVTGEAGLLTLAHEPGRMVHRDGKRQLISRVWLGGPAQDHNRATPTRRRQPMTSAEPFAVAFNRSLDWTEDLARCIQRPSDSDVQNRAYVCAFMHLVLFGLFCRLRHLSELIESKDVQTFHRVLYSGCSGDDVLVSKETEYLSDARDCTYTQAKQIVAFWQAGICGLHSFEQIHDNLKKRARHDPDMFRWIESSFKSKAFQIDKDWLDKRNFIASYRRKEACIPKWVASGVKRFAKRQNLPHLLEIGHVCAVDWIVPRSAAEVLDDIGMTEADSSILTDNIREVWTQPESNDPAEHHSITMPNNAVMNAQQSDIAQVDMMHLADSITAIFEPSNQARSLEQVAIHAEDHDEGEDAEMVPATQIPQVLMTWRADFSLFSG